MEINDENLQPVDLRNIILTTQEPLRIQNVMKSELLTWTLEKWSDMLKDEVLNFRCGKNQFTSNPQWETTCSFKDASFQDFLDSIKPDSKEWWYFDYKYLCKWFTNKKVLKEKIDWSLLGFPEVTAKETTIWIGSKGAHTPCHMDTYGCNVVYQLYGRKQWLIFPPEQNLKPTRIPFEESSIHSKLNFFSPIIEDYKGILKCRKVILNPGDILVLPHRWWHYVENMDTAISINFWKSLPQDNIELLKESIATVLVGQMTNSHKDLKHVILNPTMAEMVTCDEALNAILFAIDQSKPNNKIAKLDHTIKTQNKKGIPQRIASNYVSTIPILSEEEFKRVLLEQSQRFQPSKNHEKTSQTFDSKKVIDFLEAVTDDEVLSLIAKKLIEKSNIKPITSK